MVPVSFRADWGGGEACNVLSVGISGRGMIQVMSRVVWRVSRFGRGKGQGARVFSVPNW